MRWKNITNHYFNALIYSNKTLLVKIVKFLNVYKKWNFTRILFVWKSRLVLEQIKNTFLLIKQNSVNIQQYIKMIMN